MSKNRMQNTLTIKKFDLIFEIYGLKLNHKFIFCYDIFLLFLRKRI
jgi:hypothetical protein